MADLIKIEFTKPAIPEDWDYGESVKMVKGIIYKAKNLTEEILNELYIAREILSSQGKRTDLTSGKNSRSWNDYCEDIGVTKRAVNGWLSQKPIALLHTGQQENFTPQKVIQTVKEALGGIDLDPASCDFAQKVIQAKTYFTEEDDGLSKKWFGNVFLNPPYQMPEIKEFTNKLIDELPNIESAILLTNNNTDTKWFYKCAKEARLICFTNGRINFYTEEKARTQPTNGQAFFYFGKDENSFINAFKEIGLIFRLL